MIGRLRGELIDRTGNLVVVDVNGVGYLVTVSGNSPLRLGERVDLHVRTNVRDDAIQLFGFRDPLERDVFDMLIGVQNIGPAKAMQILGTPVQDLIALVSRRDSKALAKIPGLGKKTAERILVDLADKMVDLGAVPATGTVVEHVPSTLPTGSDKERDLYSALINLGFKEPLAADSVRRTVEHLGQEASLEDLLREALSGQR